MRTLSLTKAARADLRNIYAEIFGEWGEPQADSDLDARQHAMERILDNSATRTCSNYGMGGT